MATFKLKDGFGLDATLTPAAGALTRYFHNGIPDFNAPKLDLSQPPVKSVSSGLSFSHPIDIGTSDVELKVGASASGTLSVIVPASDGAPLFDPDTFGDNISVGKDQRYISLGLSAELQGSASASPGDLKFGFNGKSKVNLTYYQRFAASAPFTEAVEDTITSFSLPGDLDDIAAMPENSIAAVDSSGELKFSGTVNLLSAANPLATVSLPAGVGAIAVSGPAAIDVGASYKFSGDYQLRIRRLAGTTCRIGFYRQRNSQFGFTAEAKASITAKFGDNDLFVKLIQAISSDPKADLKALEAAGLSEEQAKAIQKAVKSAVNRSLEVGASLELSRADESDAMFLYEVDLHALEPAGRAMLHAALDGDLTALVMAADPQAATPVPGIKPVKTLVSNSKTLQNTFKLNLLGIYNVARISKLLLEGKTAWDADTGAMVLTDSATADKIDVFTSNLQVKDSDKLCHLLAQHFLVTAAYRSVKHVVSGPPQLSGSQTYFELLKNPGKTRMRDLLLVSAAMGLQTVPDAHSELPSTVDDFDRTTVYAEAGYDDRAFRSLFFDEKGALHPAQMYSDAGRLALSFLVEKGDDDDFRLALANDRSFFDDLDEISNVSSGEFARRCAAAGVPPQGLPDVRGDFIDVAWFRDAMVTAGTHLQAIDNFLQTHPGTDPENNDFKKLKQQLANSLGTVVDRATVEFGGPWGFETMALLQKASSKKFMLMNRFITKALPTGTPTKADNRAAKAAKPSA